MRVLTTIIQSFRIVGLLQDLTCTTVWVLLKRVFICYGERKRSSVGDKKVTSSAGQNKFSVQLEKRRFQTLSALSNLKYISRSSMKRRKESLPNGSGASCFAAGL